MEQVDELVTVVDQCPGAVTDRDEGVLERGRSLYSKNLRIDTKFKDDWIRFFNKHDSRPGVRCSS